MSELAEIPKNEEEILLKMFPNGVVAFDLETTGLSPLVDKIIEVSAIKVTPEGIDTFDQLINPGIHIPEVTTEIHGIKDEDVKDGPSAEQVLPEFLKFCGNLPLIAHNAKFDAGFLVFELHRQKHPLPDSTVYCSVKYSREVFKKMPNHRLATLVRELDIPLINHHRALDDSIASLRVFAKALLHSPTVFKKVTIFPGRLFKFKDFSRNKDMDIPEHLKGLVKKAQQGQIVDIKYSGGSMKGQFRPVRAVALLPMPDGNILYAHCLKSNLYKSFLMRKISEYRELNAEEIQERLKLLEKL